ncbi:MAG: hypothetical protein MJE66_07525 [Proteobacteria bacterium]|nr:hypothetical protein [Pseudomonadota bacterium]
MVWRWVILGFLSTLAIFAGVSWWALESSGVAVVVTRASDGSPRSTHVWYAELDGELWLEAGAPENGWFQDIQRHATLALKRDGVEAEFEAVPVPGAGDRVRRALRDKYGVRDRIVGLWVDSSRSVAVRLQPRPGP